MKLFTDWPRGFVLHHSLTKDGQTVSVPAIRRYHTQVHGWDDIGYHALVELAGNEFEAIIGRPWDYQGAHCGQAGRNHDTWGICLIGNFDMAPPPEEQLDVAFRRILVPLARIHGMRLDRSTVTFHRHHAMDGRTCPGRMFTEQMLDHYLEKYAPSGMTT